MAKMLVLLLPFVTLGPRIPRLLDLSCPRRLYALASPGLRHLEPQSLSFSSAQCIHTHVVGARSAIVTTRLAVGCLFWSKVVAFWGSSTTRIHPSSCPAKQEGKDPKISGGPPGDLFNFIYLGGLTDGSCTSRFIPRSSQGLTRSGVNYNS